VLLGLAAPSAAAPSDVGKPVFDGNPGWLVIGEATSNRREAALKADGWWRRACRSRWFAAIFFRG